MATAGLHGCSYAEEEEQQLLLLMHGDPAAEGSDDTEPIDWVGSSSSSWQQQASAAVQASATDRRQPHEQQLLLRPSSAFDEQDIPMLPLGRPGLAGQQSESAADQHQQHQQQQQHSAACGQLLPPPPLYTGTLGSPAEGQQQANDDCLEPPPPYTPSQPKFIRCKVCQKLIDIDNKQHLLVVKCASCREVTPLREPPAGKRYLRCSCNCLMMVDSSAARVVCARPSCQKVITIQSQGGMRVAASRPRGTTTVRCAHCRRPFQYISGGKKLVRCPHCRKVSVMDNRYRMRMAGIFAFVGAVLLVAALAACGVAMDNDNGSWGMFGFLGASVLISLIFLQRTFYYCRLQVSHPCQPSGAGAVP